MKLRPSIEFVSFSDGRCRVSDAGGAVKYDGLGFSNRTLGYKRHFAAASAQVRTDRAIRVPLVPGIDTHDTVETAAGERYDVELVQQIYDSYPPSLDLTLRSLEGLETVEELEGPETAEEPAEH